MSLENYSLIEIPSPVSADETFMREVYLTANRSKDPRTKIGAILVRDGILISGGYNNFPRKVKDYNNRYNDREIKLKMVVHAETNSIYNAARIGVSTLNSILYTQGIPCNDCTKACIQAGIKEIIVHAQWREFEKQFESSAKISKTSEIMLYEAGINVRLFDKVLEIKSYLDGREIWV